MQFLSFYIDMMSLHVIDLKTSMHIDARTVVEWVVEEQVVRGRGRSGW
jgi:hypothetical protein